MLVDGIQARMKQQRGCDARSNSDVLNYSWVNKCDCASQLEYNVRKLRTRSRLQTLAIIRIIPCQYILLCRPAKVIGGCGLVQKCVLCALLVSMIRRKPRGISLKRPNRIADRTCFSLRKRFKTKT